VSQSIIKPSAYKVGFISPPAWFDISPTEFLRIAPSNTIVMQTIMRSPGFDYSIEHFVNSVPELGICFESLTAAGANVVAQFGYPFSLVHGWQKAQQIQQDIQGNGDSRFVMMGVEVVYALRHLNCKSIAVASTYYSDKMAKVLHDYLTETGLNVLQSENWESHGMAVDQGSGTFIRDGELDPMDWKTPVRAVEKAVMNVSKHAPDADCILVTGGGMRLLNIVERLENEVGKPIIGGDLTLYWGILRRLGIKKGVCGHGKLLASLF
jgi:maleate cis-trans isomerase